MVLVSTEVAGSWFAVSNWLGRQFPRAVFVPIKWNLWTSRLTMPSLDVKVLVSQPKTASCYFFSQFIDWWMEYSWNVDRYVVPDFKVLSCSESLQLLGLNEIGVFSGRWFHFILYLWVWRTGLASRKLLTVLVPHPWLQDLYCFDYQTITFGYNGVPLMLVVCIYSNDVPVYGYQRYVRRYTKLFFRNWQQRATNLLLHLVPARCALDLCINFLAVTATTLLRQRPRC